MKYMSIGHKVLVCIPQFERGRNLVAQYNGQTMTIANRVSVGKDVYYELVGAESEFGVPFGFLKEWLIAL